MQPSLGLQTASGVGTGRARREPLGWTASAAEMSSGSSSRIVEVYVMCATVAGKGGMVRQSEQGEGRGTVDAALFAFADIGGGGGAGTMVGAGAEDVGVRAKEGSGRWSLRGLGHRRDGSWLGRNGALRRVG